MLFGFFCHLLNLLPQFALHDAGGLNTEVFGLQLMKDFCGFACETCLLLLALVMSNV